MSHNFYAAVDASPYLNEDEIYFKKDYHQNVIEILKSKMFDINSHSLLDVGCGNGALLNSIVSSEASISHLNVCGIDTTVDYIDYANKYKKFEIQFICQDIMKIENGINNKKYDFVLSTGVLPIFEDFTKFFDACIKCVKPGGYLIVNGRINPEPVDVKMQFRDHSRENTKEWRSDWNVHSEFSILERYRDEFLSINFEDDLLRTPIALNSEKPAVATRTFKDEFGRIIQTNGALILKDYRFFVGQLKN